MYTLKLLKQSFVNFIFSSFEKMGENWPRLEEEVKKDEFPDNIKKQSLKELLKKEETKPKLKSNTQIVKDTLWPDYIGKDWKDLKEILWKKTKEELAERKEQNWFSKEIMNNLDKKEIKILKEVLWERTINQASSWEIYTLKQEGFDLAKIFLKDSSWKFSKWKTEYKIWDSFEVEFYGNKDIDRIVGIWDILDINNVSKVSVNWSEWTRKSNPRPGFYNGRYLAIHDNFKVNILETEKFEWDEFNSAITSRFKQVRGKELNNWFYSNLDSGDSSIKIPFNAKSDKDLFSEIINNNFKKELKFDEKTWELSTIDGYDLSSKKELIRDVIWNIEWNIDFKKLSGWDLSKIDFRFLKNKYPREASIKNNNPAWLTYNSRFANTLKKYGITFYKWTSRPSAEGGNYFGFPNMEEWMNAYNLLWVIKLKKMWNKTFWEFSKNWAVDYSSYKNKFWNIWNKKISHLDDSTINFIKSNQMKIESPWMYKELKKINII